MHASARKAAAIGGGLPAAPAALLVALGWAHAGCGHQNAPDRALEKLRADVTKIQADRDGLDERLGALEAADARRTGAAPSSAGEPKAALAPLPPASTPTPALAVVRVGDVNERAKTNPREGDDDDEASSTTLPEARRDYDAATTLVHRKQYKRAAEAFTGFLVRYPDHAYTEKAMYWRGECLFAQGDYARAAAQFEGLGARFPFGNKAPSALLKLGLSQKQLGSLELASRTFADLRARYPKSDAVRQVPHP